MLFVVSSRQTEKAVGKGRIHYELRNKYSVLQKAKKYDAGRSGGVYERVTSDCIKVGV